MLFINLWNIYFQNKLFVINFKVSYFEKKLLLNELSKETTEFYCHKYHKNMDKNFIISINYK